ncbi:MAG TPA: glucose-6-phosphate dehydrogenase [Bacteroidales bacterium]|jgi:glucose-6-phosphate 1-dehydrogenase|nr:glucose-6-phosphate dehydrogenase [Bacteroidales bacterium]HOS71294.1 glucose-6-phosphate dehydrogenase [Bacteroidales bacterium]HQH23955.1 glucose-6-phosphate dehydrogenase [Bacteroidales bacterium]HQJ81285.1 glucose-6-phosphate dehydrogenase [Bacteroidales bacterium]
MEHPDNLILVIFGASGDLTSRKLIPALFSLKSQKLLPSQFAIVGSGRTSFSGDEFREKMRTAIFAVHGGRNPDSRLVREFLEQIYYVTMDSAEPENYSRLKGKLSLLNSECGTCGNYIFYLATPPVLYEVISTNLTKAGLADQSEGFRRFIIEKPFGYDLASAQKLTGKLHELISEDQIYRIDHYLGKETVQNILVTRFANGIFEPLWNRNYVHRIEITSSENLGVGERGGYYDTSGALRDMVQNHLLQMVGLTAMEPPSSMMPDAIRNEILKVFQSFQPLREEDVPHQVIRGQYLESRISGERIPAYRSEKGVSPDSRTETYVALKFFVNNWRWGGVPFYIRTGKRLPVKVTEIVIHFKRTPHHLFQRNEGPMNSNKLILRIQPDEGILLNFGMKEPGSGFNVKNVDMDFRYSSLADVRVPAAYERLLFDVMVGDSTLFSRDDVVETAWRFLEPVQNAWKNDPGIKLYGYPAGTWGPDVADNLVEGCGLTWRYPCNNLAEDGKFCEL